MSSLYAQYIAEREDKEIIESEKGFATFKIFNNGECYLQDLYVIPEQRKSGLATEMTDSIVAIAKERGCKTLLGSVCTDDKYATRNMKVFLAYGMQIYKIVGNMIFLNKNLSGEQ
jgi:ribosomal protein S18 acetylase RimI-like enzyme